MIQGNTAATAKVSNTNQKTKKFLYLKGCVKNILKQ